MKKLLLTAAMIALLAGCSSTQNTSHSSAVATSQKVDVISENQGTFFAQVTNDMPANKVRSIVGEPDRIKAYSTGKQWIPFYFGPDTSRVEWIYNDKGYVTFSRNRYSGSLSVINVSYNTDI